MPYRMPATATLVFPDRLIADKETLHVGDTEIVMAYYGPAHTPGDLAIWLPKQRVLFTGDLVVTERLLALLPIGSSAGWLQAFDAVMTLKPAVIVPGHGQPTDVKAAKRDTRDYIAQLRDSVSVRLRPAAHCKTPLRKPIRSFHALKKFRLAGPAQRRAGLYRDRTGRILATLSGRHTGCRRYRKNFCQLAA